MPIIVRENVEVHDTETEIIEEHETPHDKNRIFTISNRDQEINVKAWGSHDNENWVEKGSLIIRPNETGALIVGLDVYWVKLVGKTITAGSISVVDASLTY